jgi:hypothetical protein
MGSDEFGARITVDFGAERDLYDLGLLPGHRLSPVRGHAPLLF